MDTWRYLPGLYMDNWNKHRYVRCGCNYYI